MKAIVAFESYYGNTEQIAWAVAEGLRKGAEVTVVHVADLNPATTDGTDLIVIGGPTHMWGLSRPSTRKPRPGMSLVPRAMGVREWLERLPRGRPHAFAAFDTRINRPSWLTGSAARSIRAMLRQHSYDLIASPESYRVTGSEGPLVAGELDRAQAWGEQLLARMPRLSTGGPT
jgi:hypothetical protein